MDKKNVLFEDSYEPPSTSSLIVLESDNKTSADFKTTVRGKCELQGGSTIGKLRFLVTKRFNECKYQ